MTNRFYRLHHIASSPTWPVKCVEHSRLLTSRQACGRLVSFLSSHQAQAGCCVSPSPFWSKFGFRFCTEQHPLGTSIYRWLCVSAGPEKVQLVHGWIQVTHISQLKFQVGCCLSKHSRVFQKYWSIANVFVCLANCFVLQESPKMAQRPQHVSQYEQTKQLKHIETMMSTDFKGSRRIRKNSERSWRKDYVLAKPVALSQQRTFQWHILAIAVRSPDEPLPSAREPLAVRRPVSMIQYIQCATEDRIPRIAHQLSWDIIDIHWSLLSYPSSYPVFHWSLLSFMSYPCFVIFCTAADFTWNAGTSILQRPVAFQRHNLPDREEGPNKSSKRSTIKLLTKQDQAQTKATNKAQTSLQRSTQPRPGDQAEGPIATEGGTGRSTDK